MFRYIFLFFLIGILFTQSVAQPMPPAPPQSKAILILGAKAHLGNGKVIDNSAIAFENGKLTLVADATSIRVDASKYHVIDATGKRIYPGFIAPNSRLGLVEINAVRATKDYAEVGSLNPNVRALIAYDTDSEVTPTVRSNGTLMAQIAPSGGRISGASSVVILDAWNWEDAAYRADDGIFLNWPRMMSRSFSGGTFTRKKSDKYDGQVKSIESFFNEAKAYLEAKDLKTKNLKFEAMHGLFSGKDNLYIRVNRAKAIMESVLMAKKLGLRPVIVGGIDSWMITEFLKENDVAVILNETQSLPSSPDADIDQPFKTPAVLQNAGITFAFSISGGWQQRNLPFQAGQATGFSLDYEQAIAALTLNTAKIMGIDRSTGSLEVGKDATLFISEGDALDMRTNKVTHAFIQGRNIDLSNKQKRLYEKFRAKY
jgi:imidazolonepropionase-like amidohydrolase